MASGRMMLHHFWRIDFCCGCSLPALPACPAPRQVLLLDADNTLLVHPDTLFALVGLVACLLLACLLAHFLLHRVACLLACLIACSKPPP